MCINSSEYVCFSLIWFVLYFFCFFFNDTATTEIYTLFLHDALPISHLNPFEPSPATESTAICHRRSDRKSTRLNSSHPSISYAVFCLKKKKQQRSKYPLDCLYYYLLPNTSSNVHHNTRKIVVDGTTS